MISIGKEDYRKEQAEQAEASFISFCKKSGISFQKLDDEAAMDLRKKYLKNPLGKCPDFLLNKTGISAFLEIKTLTHFTNAKREKQIDKHLEEIIRSDTGGGLLTEVFNPLSELRGPFRTFLQDASKKFKNIGDQHAYPRILLLSGGSNVNQLNINAVYQGAYYTHKQIDGKLEYVGFQKKAGERSLFDQTGSSVSAIIYWNKDQKRYFRLENLRAKIKLTENDFQVLFGQRTLI